MEKEFEDVIKANPFDNLSEADLIFLLEHNKDKLSEAQILDVQSRISRFQNSRQDMDYTHTHEPVKTMMLTPQNKKRAGYVDITILMLSVWAMGILCMAYVYTKIGIMF
ncbi:MAG: hypothetical protein E7169_04810 [Firmicutes bacterium]|nr:hypothetical protein [Bacillota bacterium]